MKNDGYFNWLYIMGMRGSISSIDRNRADLYKSVNKEIDVCSILLYEYIKQV